MLHVALTVEHALQRLAKGEDWESVIGYESLLEMIAKTGFTDHIRKISMPSKSEWK